jgi:hypothetical protein
LAKQKREALGVERAGDFAELLVEGDFAQALAATAAVFDLPSAAMRNSHGSGAFGRYGVRRPPDPRGHRVAPVSLLSPRC